MVDHHDSTSRVRNTKVDQGTDHPTDLLRLTTESGDVVDATPLARLVESRFESVLVQLHRGPLPPPEQLQAYESVQAGFADRIVSMAEREQSHRHTMQKESVHGGLQLSRRGQHYGFGIALTVLGTAVVLVLMGHEEVGVILASVNLVSLAAVFVLGRSGAARVEHRRRDTDDQAPVAHIERGRTPKHEPERDS